MKQYFYWEPTIPPEQACDLTYLEELMSTHTTRVRSWRESGETCAEWSCDCGAGDEGYADRASATADARMHRDDARAEEG